MAENSASITFDQAVDTIATGTITPAYRTYEQAMQSDIYARGLIPAAQLWHTQQDNAGRGELFAVLVKLVRTTALANVKSLNERKRLLDAINDHLLPELNFSDLHDFKAKANHIYAPTRHEQAQLKKLQARIELQAKRRALGYKPMKSRPSLGGFR